jgi:hypothetical protein
MTKSHVGARRDVLHAKVVVADLVEQLTRGVEDQRLAVGLAPAPPRPRNRSRRRASAASGGLAAQHQKARGVLAVVLDVRPQHRHVVEAAGQIGGDGGDGGVGGRQLGGGRGGRGLLHRHVAQIRCQPAAALAESLGMRQHALDLAQVPRPRQQVLGDLQRQLAADLQLGVDQAIEGDVDGAVGGVLHWDHAEVRAAALDVLEDLGDRPRAVILDRFAEAIARGLMRERPLRGQIGDGQRRFERAARRQDLAPHGGDGLRGQRTTARLGQTIHDRRLTLRDIRRRILPSFEVSDL